MALYIYTLLEMKSILGISDTEDDSALELWMNSIQGRFDSYCERQFLYSASTTETFDGYTRALGVRVWPIEAVSSIVIDADQDWDNVAALEMDDYRVNYERGLIYYGTAGVRWPGAVQSIRVIYSGGMLKSDTTAASSYVRASDRETLRRAMFLQMNFEWRNRTRLGMNEIRHDGASAQIGAQVQMLLQGRTLLPEVESCLLPLKRMN